MKSVNAIRAFVWSATYAAAAICSIAAQAQDLPTSISPLQVEPDRNGVNIVTGKIDADAIELSIPAAPRLRFDNVQNAAPYIKGEQHRNFDTSSEMSGEWTAHTAEGMSESFRCLWDATDGKQCASVTGSGSSLSYGGNYYRKAGTGERYSYNLVHVFTNPAGSDPNPRYIRQFYASKIEFPDGEVISYTYDTANLAGDPYSRPFYRPNRISTNVGYYITISYPHNDLTQVGWGSPSVVTLYSVNDPATPLARLSSSGGAVTDLQGRVFQGYSLGTLGVDIESTSLSRTLPTESSPALVVSPAANLPSNSQMVGDINRDGVHWQYAYTNPQYFAGMGGYLFDKVDVTGPNGYHKYYTIARTSPFSPSGSRNVIKKLTNELGREVTFDYDAYLRITKVTQPEGNAVSTEWDLAGNITTKTLTAKTGSNLPSLVERINFDLGPYLTPSQGFIDCLNTVLCWRPTWHRDALNRQTDFVYNARGQLLERTSPPDAEGVRIKTSVEYEEVDTGAGLISRKKNVRVCGIGATCGTTSEVRTEFEYWANTNLTSVERQRDLASGEIRETRYTYDLSGHVLSIDGPRPGWDDTSFFRYDLHGRKTWEIGPLTPNGLRLAKRFTYRDADDAVLSVESGTLPNETSASLTVMERTDTVFDSRRNAVREIKSAGGAALAVTDRTYLERGLLECSATRMNLSALPAVGTACAIGTQGSNGADRVTRNLYDAAGQLETLTQGYGTPLARNHVRYSYTPNGKQESVTDAKGNKARYVYDGYDRRSHWYFPSKSVPGAASTEDFEQYAYDAVGNRTQLRRRDGRTLTFAYDGLNRLISKIVPDGCAPIQVGACTPAAATRDVYYRYDVMGRQIAAKFDSLSSADGLVSGYDAFGNLRTSSISMGGFTKILTATYDEAGNRTRLTHPDGQAFTYAFDAENRLTAVYDGSDTSVRLDKFTYNERGLLSARTGKFGNGASYDYDTLGRLSTQSDIFVGGSGNVTVGPIAYNPASQIVSEVRDNDTYSWRDAYVVDRAYTVNALNQYVAAGVASFTYDANGNLVSDGTTTFVYDAENRMVAASNGISLTYDPMGRLWQVAKGPSSTRLLYDGNALVAEYDNAGALSARYVHAGDSDADDPIIWYSGGTPRWLHADHSGSIAAVTNALGGQPTINTYDEYGIPGANNLGRFQYTGQAWIPELGMYYYKARMYSPTLGRFLQTDPIGYEDQINLYAYVGNDPVNRKDPSGECEVRTGSRLCEATTTTYVGTDKEGTHALFETRFKRDGALIRTFSVANGKVNDESWLLEVAVGAGLAKTGIAKGATWVAGKGAELTVRTAYMATAKSLGPRAWWKLAWGQSPEAVARWAVAQRNELKVLARRFTDPAKVLAMEARNLEKYGHKIGPTAEQLYVKYGSWEDVIRAATRTAGFNP